MFVKKYEVKLKKLFDLVKTFDLVRNSIGYCYKSELNFFQESN